MRRCVPGAPLLTKIERRSGSGMILAILRASRGMLSRIIPLRDEWPVGAPLDGFDNGCVVAPDHGARLQAGLHAYLGMGTRPRSRERVDPEALWAFSEHIL